MSHFLSYHNKSHGFLLRNYYYKESIGFFKKNIQLKNFYYLDNWFYEDNVFNNKFNKKYLSGFMIAGKLERINKVCDPRESDENCHDILKVFSPKIFIDKEYLFKLSTIIETLNKAFGENIFKDSFEKIEEDLEKSKEGVLIKLDNRIYKITRKQ